MHPYLIFICHNPELMKKNKNFISKMYVWPAVYDEMNLPGKEGLTRLCSEIDQNELAAADQKRLNDLVGKIIVPLQLACESRQYSLMSMALDCFQVPTPRWSYLLVLCVSFLLTLCVFDRNCCSTDTSTARQ
jgi:hypothetical protein